GSGARRRRGGGGDGREEVGRWRVRRAAGRAAERHLLEDRLVAPRREVEVPLEAHPRIVPRGVDRVVERAGAHRVPSRVVERLTIRGRGRDRDELLEEVGADL